MDLCIQEVPKLLGLIPHTTDEESYLDYNADVDFDKVTLMIAFFINLFLDFKYILYLSSSSQFGFRLHSEEHHQFILLYLRYFCSEWIFL